MATKEQERKAVEQIRKIVAGLGEDSYVGTALEGCLEIAEENIENDFACSMKQRWETAEARAKKAEEDKEYFRQEATRQSEHAEKAEEEKAALDRKWYEACKRADEANAKSTELWNKFRETEDKLEAAQPEIMKLKAQLYDLLIAGKE